MKKTDWQYLIDTLLFLCMVSIVFIGFLMGLFLPKGPTAPESAKYFLGLHRHQWGNIHFYLSITFTVLIIIHLIFSWKWIKGKARQIFKKGWTTGLILTAVASILVLFLFWSLYPRYPGAYEDFGVGAGKKAKQQHLSEEGSPLPGEKIYYEDGTVDVVITGQMTLRQLEKATGIPAKKIIAELELPSKTSLDETLGRLRKKYLFTLQDIRNIISDLLNRQADSLEKKEEKKEVQEEHGKKEEKKQEAIHAEEHEEKLTRGEKAEDKSGILITGRMTFQDIEMETGVPASKITDKLGLPSNIPLNETLGRLRKKYVFTIQELRDVIDSLMKKK